MAAGDSDEPTQALVVGASGGIGAAVMARWIEDAQFSKVWGVSRRSLVPTPGSENRVRYLRTTHEPDDIKSAAGTVLESGARLSRVVVALGTLHGDGYGPEKSLGSLEPDSMHTLYHVNCVLPLLWLAALAPGLRKNPDCRIALLSARVGSIGDNGLGGWYSYRSAKAALNMGLKSAAIELGRSARGTKLIAFHPGTVDTALSEPFQRGVPEDKLFSPGFVAERLDEVLDGHAANGELSYLDWAGKSIPW